MKPLKTFFKMKADEKHSISCEYKKGRSLGTRLQKRREWTNLKKIFS